MKKITSIILTLALILSLTGVFADVNYGSELQNQPQKEYTQKFTDVPKTYWAFTYISEMVSRGVLAGYPDGKFRPDDAVAREEFAKILTLAAGLTPVQPANNVLSDVKDGDWSLPYIYTAGKYLTYYEEANGYYFKPTKPATREDVAVALVLLKGYDITVADVGMIKAMFTDFNSISEPLQRYVAVAVSQGIMSGYEDGTFRGQDTVTRAEAATLLWRSYQFGNGDKVVLPGIDSIQVKPTTTPTQTTTPQVTISPTQTVEPTPTATPEPLKKTWKIQTLVDSANVKDILYTDKGVYYCVGIENQYGDKIYFTDISGKTSFVCDVMKDLQPTKANKSDNDFDLGYSTMGYNYNNGKVYLLISAYWLWDITDITSPKFVSTGGGGSNCLKFNGDKIYVNVNSNLYEFKDKPKEVLKSSSARYIYFINGEIYGMCLSGSMEYGGAAFAKYNFSTGDYDKIDYDKTMKDYIYRPSGQYGNCLYFDNNGDIYKTDTNGDSTSVVLKDDVNVLDMKTFSLDMLSICDDSNFAVYSEGAIRLISKN